MVGTSIKMKLQGILESMKSFHKSTIKMKNPGKVAEMVSQIIADGKSKLQVVTDFDRTLTCTRGDACPAASPLASTCFEILDQSELMPQIYRDETTRLRDKYYPIEIDPNLTIEQKLPMAVEWYTQAHEVMLKTGLRQKDLVAMVRDSSAKLREGTDQLLERLHQMDVPVLIFSAGLGDLIHALLDQHADNHDNIKVVSNYMRFDDEGKMVGFHDELIHMYNKNENSVHSSAYFERLRGRNNVLLMGDNVGDLRMADGVENPNVTLRIGFLNDYSEERLAKFLDMFDIVLVDDQTMDVGNDIVTQLA
ncbi:cytosolic 5'-nucleotidase 3-like isoform X2 [Pollicipes pollicipes]|uniref:cytosolic 5'-nucleotidase 3-like isoform X2 n=1 Tax=Pollicipes pollicipes TaxID=41117 RepID=UPI001884E972|nr:cytosolic 5'-nucleotidase 3-like isoform X2 [Pollicipes pollicipes]